MPTPRTFFEGVRSLPPGPRAQLRAGGRAGDRALLAAAGRGDRRDRPPRPLAARGGRRGPRAARGRGRAAADLRRAARRLPQRGDRLERRRRDDGGAARPAGADVHDRLRGPRGLRRAPVRAGWWRSATPPTTTSSSSSPEAVDLVERLVWHHDQPFGDSSAMPTFLLSELTRGDVTVALSGDGGDEVFAGYERFAAGLAARRFAALPAPVRRTAVGAAGLLPARALRGRAGRLQRFAGVAEQGLPDAYRAWISTIQDPERDRAARRAPRRLGGRGLPRDLGLVRGRSPARPPARPQPAHVPARRPAGEDRPDEHGARARGALPVPRRRAARASPPACRRPSRPAA